VPAARPLVIIAGEQPISFNVPRIQRGALPGQAIDKKGHRKPEFLPLAGQGHFENGIYCYCIFLTGTVQ
jgi:hypothetical protein